MQSCPDRRHPELLCGNTRRHAAHTCEDEALLNGRNPLFLLDSLLDAFDCICGLDIDLNLAPGERLDLDGHAPTELGKRSQ